MIYSSDATPLMEQLQVASEVESLAIKTLLSYMQSGGNDNDKLNELTDNMTNTHNKKMDIFDELQQFRLNK